MATFTTYNAASNKETLMDLLTFVEQEKTPFLSTLSQKSVDGTHVEWVTDALTAANSSNAMVEGADYSFAAATDRTKVENYTQIFYKDWKVSNTQEVVDKAGVKSEWAHQMDKSMREIKRDMEKALFQGTMSAGTVSAGRALKGAQAFITTTAATTSAFDVDDLNGALEDIWDQGGYADEIYVNGTLKRAISGFTAGTTKNVDAKDGKLYANVDVFVGDFGMQKVVLDAFVAANVVVILEKKLWSLGILRPLKEDANIAKTGDSRKGAIVGEVTLICHNESGNGKITVS